jgi:deazaflavin-dependent oxidoreductase (nitroreductase family)
LHSGAVTAFRIDRIDHLLADEGEARFARAQHPCRRSVTARETEARRRILPMMTDLLNGIPRVDPTSGPTGLRALIARIPTTRVGAAIHRALFAPIDATLMRATGGRVSSALRIVPLVVLRTTGARSGVQRETPVGYFTDGDDIILIATNYGRAQYPGWYHNLLEHPECQLLANGVEGRGGRFVARLAQGADRDRLFALAQRYSPNYTTYAEKTAGVRQMPIFRLAPKTS